MVYRLPVDKNANGTIKLNDTEKDDLIITIVSAVKTPINHPNRIHFDHQSVIFVCR
ncbi:MAG: hypothetical protein Ct9H300mP19_02910 [Dehalococcoidia bacterium]|nr:MAG: hypothetical protein Ct9H300mP19_02910 [Dehalococcoidia bacterium]